MQKLLKNKLIIIALIFILLITNLTNVFALSYTEEQIYELVQNCYKFLNDKGYDTSQFINYVITDNIVVFCASSDSIYITSLNELYAKSCIGVHFDTTTLNVIKYYDNLDSHVQHAYNRWGICTGDKVYYTTTNLGSLMSKNIDFFPMTPLEMTVTETLVETTTQVQIAEQLKIMIVGFLKYLLVLVISLLAFWKGWQFLLMQLRKA